MSVSRLARDSIARATRGLYLGEGLLQHLGERLHTEVLPVSLLQGVEPQRLLRLQTEEGAQLHGGLIV